MADMRRVSLQGPGLVLLLLPLAGGCHGDPAELRQRLTSRDRHAAFLAALTLVREHPRRPRAALNVIARHLDDELAWNRAGARRALALVEEQRPELLFELLILKGWKPAVSETLLPVFDRADGAIRRTALELVRKHDWIAPPGLRERLLAEVRATPGWALELEDELARGPDDAQALRDFLDEVRDQTDGAR